MTPETFRHRLAVLGLTIRGFSTLTGPTVTTVSYWGRERPGQASVVPFPPWVALLLDAWERGGVGDGPQGIHG